ncbi:ABC transporter substrate-binding protein [Ktedonosporobacter rubrisoli]|nr:ABC transporter substrate-binding protein [Ktedonosporobacter rubrisoli]
MDISRSRQHFLHTIVSIFLALLTLQLAACGIPQPNSKQSAPPEPGTYKPVTLQNCGHTLIFTKPPERVISTYQTTTDILLKLGLEKHIVGIYFGSVYQPQPEFDAQYKHLNDLGGSMLTVPPKEKVLSLHADFVFSAYPAGDFLASYGSVTQEQFNAIGAQIYGMSGECAPDSIHVQATSVYEDILNIGRIFSIEARAQTLVNSMRARVEAIQKRLAHRPLTPVIAMPDFSATQMQPPFTFIGAGIYTDILRLAGGNNLFAAQNQTYPSISQEALAIQKPEVYVLIHYKDADAARLTSYLFTTYPNIPASRQHRTITIEANQWDIGLFMPNTVETLAHTLHPEVFA